MGIVRKTAFRAEPTVLGEWETVVTEVDAKISGRIGFRPWQKEAFNQLKRAKYWSLLCPMGSGKSVEIQALTHYKLSRDRSMRTIIAVPQTVIAHAFRDVLEVSTPNGTLVCSISRHNYFENSDPSIDGLIAFLDGGSGKDVEDRIALCS